MSDNEKGVDEEDRRQQRQQRHGTGEGSGGGPPAADRAGEGDSAATAAAARRAATASVAQQILPDTPGSAGDKEAELDDPRLDQLLAVLGEGVSRQRGRQLLSAARGDVQAAVNGFLDSQRGGAAGSDGNAAPAATTMHARGAAAGASPPAPAGSSARGGGQPGRKRPVAAATSKGVGKRMKGAAGSPMPAGQRSIAAFFKRPAQQQQQQQQESLSPALANTASEEAPEAATPVSSAEPAALPVAARGEEEVDDLALTPGAPLAAPSQPSSTEPAAAGRKPKLQLPPPPSPGGAGAAHAGFFLRQRQGQGAAAGGGRETEVAAEVLALPLDQYDPVENACWHAGKRAPHAASPATVCRFFNASLLHASVRPLVTPANSHGPAPGMPLLPPLDLFTSRPRQKRRQQPPCPRPCPCRGAHPLPAHIPCSGAAGQHHQAAAQVRQACRPTSAARMLSTVASSAPCTLGCCVSTQPQASARQAEGHACSQCRATLRHCHVLPWWRERASRTQAPDHRPFARMT